MPLMPNTNFDLLKKIDPEGGLQSCWEFQGHLNHAGYGHIRCGNRKTVKAHRWAYQHFYGYCPDNLVVRHTCDNRACCNPLHLTLGKHVDNMKDMVMRERSVKYPLSKMKELYAQGLNKMQIAKVLGCLPETVYRKLTAEVLEGLQCHLDQ